MSSHPVSAEVTSISRQLASPGRNTLAVLGRYNRVVIATYEGALVLAALIAFIVYQISYQSSLSDVQGQVAAQAQQVDGLVSRSVIAMQAVPEFARQYLVQHEHDDALARLPYFRADASGAYYSLVSVSAGAPRLYGAVLGNLAGVGKWQGRDPFFYRELDMALALTPQFHFIQKLVPQVQSVDYTSANLFTYSYPWNARQGFSPDTFTQPWPYQAGLARSGQQGQVFWTAPYLDSVHRGLVISLSAPIYVGTRFVGSAAMDMSLVTLTRAIKAENSSPGTFILADQQGTVLAHPTLVYSGQDTLYSLVGAVPRPLGGLSMRTGRRQRAALRGDPEGARRCGRGFYD